MAPMHTPGMHWCVPIAILGGLGCAGPHGMRLATEHDQYRAGDRIQLHLTANRDVSYNLCDSRLERLERARWQTVENGHSCPDLLLVMRHGTSGAGTATTIPLDERLPTGTYRLVQEVEDAGSPDRSYAIATAPVAVRAASPQAR